MIGGATTSRRHTAVKIAPLADLWHNASRAVGVASKLLGLSQRELFMDEVNTEYDALRESFKHARKAPLVSLESETESGST